jgi:hypothetical protein
MMQKYAEIPVVQDFDEIHAKRLMRGYLPRERLLSTRIFMLKASLQNALLLPMVVSCRRTKSRTTTELTE